LRGIIIFLLAASAALAFTPDHIVIVDGAVVYDEEHNYEDDHIIARLPYWTPVVAEYVGTPASARTYCLVTLEDGRYGLTEWDNVGWALRAVRDDVAVYEGAVINDDGGAVVDTLAKGEVVAFRTGAIECEGIITAERLEGWVRKSDIEPLVPIEEIPPIPEPDE
jgi:hypothetical protein